MTAYRHLLCPVDFSESSRRALEWSSRFSKEVGARLSVLHVVDTEFLSIGNLVAVPDAFGELRRRAEEALTALKREIDLGHADVEIVEGVPEDVLVTAANQRDVDLLVMGTHGLSGFQRFLLGSVTEKVLHRALVPLLALSPWVEQQQTMGFLAPRTIVMAIDFGPESQSVLRHGIWLAEHFRAKLVALHVVSVPYVALNESSFEPRAQLELERITDSLIAKRRKDLEGMLLESTGGETEVVLTVGSPFESLRNVVEDRSGAMVIMGAGGHGNAGIRWLGSTCHKMVRWASCPVMVVR
ncbi:MAG TPA: universal stress protein [Vicinamibacteria bacterium]|nr:universal stress protein [Vicinamibacteria bacterium]